MLCVVVALAFTLFAACNNSTPAASDDAAAAPPAASDAGDSAPAASAGGGGYTIPTVVKLIGIGWFDRMEEGITEWGAQTGNNTSLLGPPQADAALQNQILEDLIAQNVDAISVVPFSPEACEPVLKKAMDNGIVVIAHEADNQQNCDYDIEAFNNFAYGGGLMDLLAKAMGEEGKYYTTVGSVTSKSQNQWEEGGVARQEEAYPNMELVERKIETHDEQKKSQEIMVEMLKKYPDLRGFQGATSQDAPGGAQAVEDAGLIGKVFVVGTTMPSISSKYLENGSLFAMGLWDPAQAGKAMNQLALMCLEGQRDLIVPGLNLGIDGYENIQLNEQTEITDRPWRYLEGSAMIKITSVEEMANYPF